MIKELLLTIVFLNFSFSFISNQDSICHFIKGHMYYTISVYKNLTDEQRDTLYKFSLRGLTYEILKNSKFTSSSIESKKQNLLAQIQNLRQNFKGWRDIDGQEMEDLQAKYIQQFESVSENEVSLNLELSRKSMDFSKKKDLLESIVSQLKQEFPDFDRKLNMLGDLEQIGSLMTTTESNWETFGSILLSLEKVFSSEDPSVLLILKNYRETLDSYFAVENIVKTNAQTAADFQFKPFSELDSDLANLESDLEALKSQLDGLKSSLNQHLTEFMEKLRQEIQNNPNYEEYKAQLLQAKDLLVELKNLHFSDNDNKRNLKFSEYILSSTVQMQVRIHPHEISELERKMTHLKKLKSLKSDAFAGAKLTDPDTASSVQAFLGSNESRVEEIDDKLEALTQKWTIVKSVHEAELELDKVLGLVFTSLQGGLNPSASFIKCFSNLEISVYMFYMSLFQMIVSRKAFYEQFIILGTPKTEQLPLVKQIFNDIIKESFRDSQMIEFDSGQFAPGGLQRSMSNYILLSNIQMDLIFKEQMAGITRGIFHSIMAHAGFTFDFVKQVIKGGTLGNFIDVLTLSLLTFLSVATPSMLLILFVSSFLSVLSEQFFAWTEDYLAENPWITREFNLGISKIYSMFASEQFDSLDFEDELAKENEKVYQMQTNLKQQENTTINDPESRVDYFSMKFKDIISMFSSQFHKQYEITYRRLI